MSTICLCLHVHQPSVLRHYSVFDSDVHYFDGYKSREACRRFAVESILPTNEILIGLKRRLADRFFVSCSISGAALDIFERFFPEVIDSFQLLNEIGAVEFLAVPYYNCLSFLYSPHAFTEQVEMHRRRIHKLFDQKPRVFRNSELIYGDEIADSAAQMGFAGVLCEGSGEVLAGRPCSRVYAGGQSGLPLLLRNERLSRDVSERFTDRGWDQWPLTAPRFAEWLRRFANPAEVVVLEWEYATFGLQMGPDTGIFDFLRFLPEKVLEGRSLSLRSVSQALERHLPAGEYRPEHYISSAENGGDLSAWLGNPMQSHAAHRLFALEEAVRARQNPQLLQDWRRLTGCEYIAEMQMGPSRRANMGGWVAAPDSPYDAYINFMNICDNLAARSKTAISV